MSTQNTHPWRRTWSAPPPYGLPILTRGDEGKAQDVLDKLDARGWERFPDEKYRNSTPYRLN